MTDRAPAPPAGAAESRAPEVRVLAHTHWDREWYQPAGRFRQRLVALVDDLLDGAATPESPFLLDGQAIVLEDYLAVRPDRRVDLAARLASGALEAGPWYVLADELIPGAEALVRNLLEGRRQLRALGAAAPAVLYCPDSFGHPAALPELARGFGFGLVVLWRGYGGARWPAGDAAWWRAPSGARALLYHLPPDGYEFGASLPADDASARSRWAAMRDVLAPRARLDILLIHNGADHHAPQRARREALAALRAAAAPSEVRATSLDALAGELVAAARDAALPEVAGELRDSYGYTWALQGAFASRAAQKRRNARVERLLARDAEPWMALAAWARPAADRARAAALGDAAWRVLLQCHPHDTLCGCSTDEVARAMDARLDDAHSQGSGLRDDAIAALAAFDAAAARDAGLDAWRPSLVVRNPAARARGGAAEVTLRTELARVAVGSGSAGTLASVELPERATPPRVRVVAGTTVQVLSRRVRHHRVESPLHYPSDALVLEERALALVPAVAGYGLWAAPHDAGGAPADVTPARVEGRALANGRLRVAVERRGRVALDAGAWGVIDDLLGFESVADAGDLYTSSPRGAPVRARCVSARALHRGPLRAALRLRYELRVPRALDDPRLVAIRLSAAVSLDAGAEHVRVDVRGVNRARDHRLRVRLGGSLAGAGTLADAAFGPVWRSPLSVPAHERARETPPPTAPLHRWVTRVRPDRGFTVASDGLAEYEAGDDGAVWVTLVRAVGELSRADLPERPGHAGWPVPTPQAQSLGAFAARLALLPHGPDGAATRARVERFADDVLLPLCGETMRATLAAPAPTAGVELEGEGLAFGALKLGDDLAAGWTVARCVNVTDETVAGAWRFGVAVREAARARLDESPAGPLTVHDGVVRFDAAARAVVTILVR